MPRYWHICKSKVDLPMPGSPPKSTIEPFTSPPPSTLSSSDIPVLYLTSSPETSASASWTILSARSTPERLFAIVALVCGRISISSRVFHAPQEGHLPFHFGVSAPHSRQTYALLDFGIYFTFLSLYVLYVYNLYIRCQAENVFAYSREKRKCHHALVLFRFQLIRLCLIR